MSFKIGETVLIYDETNELPQGVEGIIIGDLITREYTDLSHRLSYELELADYELRKKYCEILAEPHELKKLPPKNTITTWKDCIFKPNEKLIEIRNM